VTDFLHASSVLRGRDAEGKVAGWVDKLAHSTQKARECCRRLCCFVTDQDAPHAIDAGLTEATRPLFPLSSVIDGFSSLIVSLQAASCFVSLRACGEKIQEMANYAERAAMADAIAGLTSIFPHSAAGRSEAPVPLGCLLHGCVRSEAGEELMDESGVEKDRLNPPQAVGGSAEPLGQGCSECNREVLQDSVERMCRLREAKLDLALLRFWDSV
jgi:hypothetical protein